MYEDKPSEMFLDAMDGGYGSSEIECTWCNRNHLCPDSGYEEESWKNYCEEEHKKNPNGVVLHHNCDDILGREMNGYMFVIGCPCNGLRKYEGFVWEQRNMICRYLKIRIEQEHEWAEQELTKNILAGISSGDD